MNAKEAILTRRSVRKFKIDLVPKDLIEALVLAGRSAPTAMNRQEIKFYVIANNPKKVLEIGNKVLENRAKVGKQGGWRMNIKKNME